MGTKKQNEQYESIRVFIRIRPLNKKEILKGYNNIILYDDINNTLVLNKVALKCDTVSFNFDRVFTEASSQSELYRTIASPIVHKAFEGYNGTIFAYGQTGSGKTFTMANTSTKPEMNGLIPHAFDHIFAQISKVTDKELFVLSVTYLEIYNEQFRDLLAPETDSKLELREHKVTGPYVSNLRELTVKSSDNLLQIFNCGNKHRMTRSTEVNDVSSRSHAIFTISIESNNKITKKATLGKLHFVDLAGSERASKTKANGDCLREACSINLSLMVLGNVISALVDGKSVYIPYRNSKLTRLLQNSLGGNSKTAMIAMISPCEVDTEETKCTLHYATRVKSIKNRTYRNIAHGHLQAFEKEIRELKKKILALSTVGNCRPQDSATNKKIPRKRTVKDEYNDTITNNKKLRDELLEQIACIQAKLIVGGENMYQKAQLQTQQLETSGNEIEELNRTNQELEDTLTLLESEIVHVEEKHANLQEEDTAITDNIVRVQKTLAKARKKHAFDEHQHQMEIEMLREQSRALAHQVQLAKLLIDKCVTQSEQKLLNDKITWDDEVQEFKLNNIAFAGNNLKRAPLMHRHVRMPTEKVVTYGHYLKGYIEDNSNTFDVDTYEEFIANMYKPGTNTPLQRTYQEDFED